MLYDRELEFIFLYSRAAPTKKSGYAGKPDCPRSTLSLAKILGAGWNYIRIHKVFQPQNK